ncbi:putative zinc-type alcohol dehydrogenase-like protein [Lentzea atacamensis]|uniref:alcohol dehydrogenase (NADP(+)) n=1 Tax=Lentzea atacamensis TaxID=531938 RepID=A0ABX9EF97_9PSEU|nr:NAD(P)-dependent alcohol dehydrogenase [Lentzea atacamensis]RAS69862.1 putative zinc-type alcohol dehydrogenase-like protein [Lentzea atacamensis]
MRSTTGWQARGTTLHAVPIPRRDLRHDDIAVRVDFCGVCHTDLHAVRSHNGEDVLVPGHEFTGVVTEVGPDVTAFRAGDPVAVGNIVDSCGLCTMCAAGQENFCREFPTLTYGGTDRRDGTTTLGGFSREYVVRDRFAHPLPAGLDPAAAAPLMCAGITVWEPLRALGVGPGTRVAVAGLGGLGHLAVKFAAAMGAEVSVVSRSADRAGDAARLGAHDVVVSTDPDSTAAARDRFDVLINTIPVPHDLGPYLNLVAMDGTLSQVGYLGSLTVETMDLLLGRKKLTSGGSGGLAATAAMLEFSAAHGITADIELLPSGRVTEALDRLARGDVRYRFVLDLSDLG